MNPFQLIEVTKLLKVIVVGMGLAIVVLGLIIAQSNSGSCPAITSGSAAACDHTFAGTSIWIGDTSKTIMIAGGTVLIAGCGLAATYYARRHFNARRSS